MIFIITSIARTVQLLESIQDWALSLRSGNSVDVIYIDFSRAFDSIVHSKLLAKLTAYGIGYELHAWIGEFLVGRQQKVVVDHHFSKTIPVRSGVPQGSVLGPLLFLLFINDIFDSLPKPVTAQLFADDVKLYSSVTSKIDLVQALKNVENWSEKWQLKINETKSSVLHVGKGVPGTVYSIAGHTLPIKEMVRDLGIEIDPNLKFSTHIKNIVGKAVRRLGVLCKAFTCRDPHFMKLAFTTYVRPLLEYCTQIWSPSLIKFIDSIENVQRSFTRRIPVLKNL
jgi:ribonuclease P/MRP protein subunit RPP40